MINIPNCINTVLLTNTQLPHLNREQYAIYAKSAVALIRRSTEDNTMKNPHIELVKKWLADPKSVSQEELERAAAAADAADAADVDAAVAYAAAAADAANVAARSARSAKYWVKEYEELTQ